MKLGPGTELRSDRDDAARRGHVGALNFRGDRESGADGLPRLRYAPFDHAEPKTRVPKSVTNRIDLRRQSRFSTHETRNGRPVRNTEPAAERQTS